MRPHQEDLLIDSGLTYFDHASVSPLTKAAYQELQSIIDGKAKKGTLAIDFLALESYFDNFNASVARLINGEKEGVTFTFNTSAGLHIIADGLHSEYNGNKNVVITGTEFASNSYVWQQLCKRYVMDLRVVPFRNGNYMEQDWEKLVDDNTVLVSVSHVQFSTGFRSDLRFLSELCKRHGAYLAVDIIQSSGIVPFDVKKAGVDFVSSGAYKWLTGPFGTGFLYASPEVREKLDSKLLSWFSGKDFKLEHTDYVPWDDGKRLLTGFTPAISAFAKSIDTVIGWGIEESYNSSVKVQNYILDSIDFIKFRPVSSLEPAHRSGILCLKFPDYSSTEIVEYLTKQNIVTSDREGSIRISVHGYNNKEDANVLIETLRRWVQSNPVD